MSPSETPVIPVVSNTVGLTRHDAGSLDAGYVLFTPSSNTTYLIDKCVKVKTWPVITNRDSRVIYCQMEVY
jgi:hypothetical protein